MTLAALIFDVDGTLAETEEPHRAAFNRTFAAHGIGWTWSVDDYRWLLNTTGGKERMRAWQARLGPEARRLGDAEIVSLHKEKTVLYGEILAAGALDLRPGVREMVAAARAAGLKLAVATTTNRPNVAALTRCCWQAEPEEVFDVIAAGDEVAAKKPAPDVFELALARLGLAPGACIAFEDSLNGLQAAQGAGLATVVTPSVYTETQDFGTAQLVRPDLDGLTLDALAALLPEVGQPLPSRSVPSSAGPM